MRKYFDFNSTRPKSVFEGIDFDDEYIEDVQLKKPTIQNDFKQEQFRMFIPEFLKVFRTKFGFYKDFKMETPYCGSYIKDEQKHYTCIIRYFLDEWFVYMFDYCFETNNLIIYYNIRFPKKDKTISISASILDLISDCKFPMNIYIGAAEIWVGYNNENLLEVASRVPKICNYAYYNGVHAYVPHKFFDKFKGFASKFILYNNNVLLEDSRFFELKSDYEKWKKWFQQQNLNNIF